MGEQAKREGTVFVEDEVMTAEVGVGGVGLRGVGGWRRLHDEGETLGYTKTVYMK